MINYTTSYNNIDLQCIFNSPTICAAKDNYDKPRRKNTLPRANFLFSQRLEVIPLYFNIIIFFRIFIKSMALLCIPINLTRFSSN